jgi:hypothetical protein
VDGLHGKRRASRGVDANQETTPVASMTRVLREPALIFFQPHAGAYNAIIAA